MTRQKLERLVCTERFREAVASAMLARYGKSWCSQVGFRKGSADGVDAACPGIMGFRLGPAWIRDTAYTLFDGELRQLPLVLATLPEQTTGGLYHSRFEQVGLRVLYGLLLEGE